MNARKEYSIFSVMKRHILGKHYDSLSLKIESESECDVSIPPYDLNDVYTAMNQ